MNEGSGTFQLSSKDGNSFIRMTSGYLAQSVFRDRYHVLWTEFIIQAGPVFSVWIGSCC